MIKPRRHVSLDATRGYATMTLRLVGEVAGQRMWADYRLDQADVDLVLRDPDLLKWHWDELEKQWQAERMKMEPEL